MKLIKVAAAVLNQTPMDWDGNRAHILDAIEAARRERVSVLCLPELCITGYGCEDEFHSAGLCETAWRMLGEIVPATKDLIVSLGLPLRYEGGLFNVACLAVAGRIAGFVAKRFLAGDGIHYEPRWFKPWPSGIVANLKIGNESYPLGDLHFDCGGVRIGFEICEDAWVANRPGAELALEGVDIILNPSASHFAFGKIDVRQRLVVEGSRTFGCTYVYSNLLGNEAGRAIYDGGALIASGGRLCAVGPRFSFKDFVLPTAVVNIDSTRTDRARTASFRPNLAAKPAQRIACPYEFAEQPAPSGPPKWEDWELGPHRKEEEFTRAETLGLFDYLRKSRSSGFVISLSGGADSSALACLVALMCKLCVQEIGIDEVLEKLRISNVAWASRACASEMHARDAHATLANQLLTCVYQSTENSSATTLQAARTLAQAINARFIEFDVDRIVKDYVAMVSRALGRELTWEQDDIALQNIQARARAPGVWMLANLNNALLLATSNRSEAAVGYATMDGDTCGGLSPIAGIDKAFLREWLCWLRDIGPHGLQPIPQLQCVIAQTPTAELRPANCHQTDEDDLMPYDLLDAIERAAIRDKYMPIEVYRLMRAAFPQHSPQKLLMWVERFFRLWSRNQWKRERYAPSFHLDDENLDPKTWCRFPILSGGFERELRELREYVAREETQ